METLLLPFKILSKNVAAVLIPAIPIIFLIAFLMTSDGGIQSSGELLEKTDFWLAGDIKLSSANITAYSEISTNVQLPLIRIGGIAEKTNINEIGSSNFGNFHIAFIVIFLTFISYAMISRIAYAQAVGESSFFGLSGINKASVALAFLSAFFTIFFSSFYVGGLKLLIVINFGLFFCFFMPYAASGRPLGSSIYKGTMFYWGTMGKVVAAYVGGMGVAILAPIVLLSLIAPLIVNLPPEQATLATYMKIFLGLFAIVFGLFYQMALCASIVFEKDDEKVEKEEPKEEHVSHHHSQDSE